MPYDERFFDQHQPRGKHAAPTAPVPLVRPAPRPPLQQRAWVHPPMQSLAGRIVAAAQPAAVVALEKAAVTPAPPKPPTWFGWSRTTVAVVVAVAVVLGVTLTLLLAPRVAPASVAQTSSACGASIPLVQR